DVTRPSRDGGRDAVGQLRIGAGPASILVDFALEAKCYSPPGSVGVRDMSRLISRLRHRQFGILVTTTWL
ncbi:restriction endonuclease, partial [Acinetobacter baumannii]